MVIPKITQVSPLSVPLGVDGYKKVCPMTGGQVDHGFRVSRGELPWDGTVLTEAARHPGNLICPFSSAAISAVVGVPLGRGDRMG